MFSVNGVPNSSVEFFQDNQGNTNKFKLILKVPTTEWDKISQDSAISDASPEHLRVYEGRYAAKGNVYLKIDIKADSGHLTGQLVGETVLDYYPLSPNKFIFKKDDFSTVYEFKADKRGHINRIFSMDSGPIICV